jgi:hypothetical protein
MESIVVVIIVAGFIYGFIYTRFQIIKYSLVNVLSNEYITHLNLSGKFQEILTL